MRMTSLAGLAGAAFLSMGFDTPTVSPPPPLTLPEATPGIMAYYPAGARARGAAGQALLSCRRSDHYRLTDCELTSESPPGLGFGAAALALAKLSVDNPKLSLTPSGVRETVAFAFKLDPPGITPNTLMPMHVYSAPRWLKRATAYDVERVYPADAFRGLVSGYVVLSCTILESGKLAQCKVEDSQPLASFGPAALKLAPMFLMGPMLVDGEPHPPAGTVQVPIRFAISH